MLVAVVIAGLLLAPSLFATVYAHPAESVDAVSSDDIRTYWAVLTASILGLAGIAFFVMTRDTGPQLKRPN